jgi:hypothetical protein
MRPSSIPAMRCTLALSLCAFFLGAWGSTAFADDSCGDFKWDVSKERALFAAPAQTLAAGKDRATAPALTPDHLYQLRLVPQSHVAFVTPPAKKMLSEDASAGITTLSIPQTGSYRISVDLPFWIDVVSDGALVKAADFQGQHDCAAPHKIVEFELTAAQSYVLQFSGAVGESVRVTITRSPGR